MGCHLLLQGIFPDSGVKPRSPALQADSLPLQPPGRPLCPEWPPQSMAAPRVQGKGSPGEGTGEGMLPRWGLGEGGAVFEKQSGARPPWSMFPGGCFGPGLLCHTHSLNLILRITLSISVVSLAGGQETGLRPLNPCLNVSV